MGNCVNCRKNSIEEDWFSSAKEGVLYTEYIPRIKPLDVIMFRGKGFVSDLICFLEKRVVPAKSSTTRYGDDPGAFSHIGVIVTSEILNDPRLEDGKLYIWESTMSGSLSDGVYNIKGESFLGVQLRDFCTVIEAHDSDPSTRIAVAHLKESVREKLYANGISTLRENFSKIFTKYDGTRYDANIFSLGSSVFPCIRPARETIENTLDTDEWLFCSELVATVFTDLGIFPVTTEPKNVVPMDFLGYDADDILEGGIPVVVEKPIYIVSKIVLGG